MVVAISEADRVVVDDADGEQYAQHADPVQPLWWCR